ncbi:MAG: hypothetical protein ACI4MN_00145 [Candidatus Coproplasma sp.]
MTIEFDIYNAEKRITSPKNYYTLIKHYQSARATASGGANLTEVLTFQYIKKRRNG